MTKFAGPKAGPQTAAGWMLMGLFGLLLAVIVLTARPWERPQAALRPDTGTRAAVLDEAGLESVLSELLLRVYGAFADWEEEAIYDGLSTAVADAMLTDLYLQRRRAQMTAPPETAGAAQILSVVLNELSLLAPASEGYRIRATWTVTGLLGHDDHQHERVNRYTADVTLGTPDGAWRLTAFDLDQIQREDVPLFLDPFE